MTHAVQTAQPSGAATTRSVVSGSMDGIKSALYGAVLDCEDLVNPTIHLFSTRVADISTPIIVAEAKSLRRSLTPGMAALVM